MESVPTDRPWLSFQLYEGEWIQPPEYRPSWEGWKEIEHDNLNSLKDSIDELEKDNTWEIRKKLVNPYELVFTNEEKKYPISLSNVKPLSRSYFKMIEILDLSDFFNRTKKIGILRSAHVCEGPGGFIQAFLEQASKKAKGVEFVIAMTLKPTHSQIPGWKRAINFLKKHPEIKICYGADGTGDIYNFDNQQAFIDGTQGKKVHLFTADGGFDFKLDYIHQEQTAFRLIVSSFAMGFDNLANGGVCVVKLFDTFGKAMLEFLSFIACHFKHWTLYKPAMSRPCNSERYFVGIGFLGKSKGCEDFFKQLQIDLREKSVQNLESIFDDSSCFSESMNQIQTYQKNFEEKQVSVLKKAIHADLENKHIYWKECYTKSEEWCQRFQIPYKKIVAH